jgi:hypothetical protein
MIQVMTSDKQPYEAPTLEVVGAIHEITKAGSKYNSDILPFKNNTAYGPSDG